MDHQHLNIRDSNMNMNMDETEDEEVKKNCFGMKHYESSEDESDSDEEPSFPVNFRCEKPTGCGVIRPKPLSPSQTIQEETNYQQKKFIIHNECEFSDESGESDEEDVDDDNSSPHIDSRCAQFQEIYNASEDTESDTDASKSLHEESEEGSSDEDEENYADVEDDDESDSSISSCESSDDGHVHEKNRGNRIILEWDQGHSDKDSEHGIDHDHVEDEPVLVTKVSGSFSECSEHDDDSISAEAIKNVIEHPDSSVMCFSESEEAQDDMMASLDDISNEDGASSQKSLKRTLSTSNYDQTTTNISPEQDEGLKTHKRNCRRISLSFKRDCDGLPTCSPPFLPSLSLGAPLDAGLLQRRGSPDFSSDDDVVDSQLAEELGDVNSDATTAGAIPVPLLTPPGTPVTYSSGGIIPVCEWPSNLTVDIALTSAIELRPLPLSSLAKLEEQDIYSEDVQSPLPPRARSISEPSTTGLTPLVGSMGMPRLKC